MFLDLFLAVFYKPYGFDTTLRQNLKIPFSPIIFPLVLVLLVSKSNSFLAIYSPVYSNLNESFTTFWGTQNPLS